MSSALDDALSAATKRADRMVDLALRAPEPTSGGGLPLMPAMGPGNLAGVASATTAARQYTIAHAGEQYRHYTGWVYACVRPIAQRIAGQPIRVARLAAPGPDNSGNAGRSARRLKRISKARVPQNFKAMTDDMELLDNHPLLDTLNDPNAVMVRWILMYVTVASLELTGRAFWWCRKREPDLADYPGQWEIWPIPSSWVTPIHEDGRLYVAWEVRPDQSVEPIRVPGEEMGYLYYPDPGDPLNAISPLQAQARAVVADESIQEAQRRSFQGIHPGVMLTIGRHPDVQGTPGQRPILTRTQRQEIIALIKAFYRGVMHHDEPLILDGMIEKAEPFTRTNRDMDYLNSGKSVKERIAQGFGVNPIIMGQVEGANRASSATADDHFCSTTVNPKIELISECLTAWMGPLFRVGRERILVFLEPATAYDPDLELSRMKFLRDGGGLSVNEQRQALGWPSIIGGDVCLVPAGMVPANIVREGEVGSADSTFLPDPEPAPQTPADESGADGAGADGPANGTDGDGQE